MTDELIAVRLESGLVIWHTLEDWAALVKGVDLEAAEKASGPLEDDD